MVRPPDAEPVMAARMLVATASETSGPPPIDSTQSRTTLNAGTAATTAPKPTRLATLRTGSTDAFAPGRILGASQPPQAESKYDRGINDAETGRRQRRRAEERHRDGVLDRRGSRQRRHRKCGRSQSDRRWHQPIGNSRGAEQDLRH